jgi:hypothetical protein
MVRIFDQTEMTAAWILENTDYIHLTSNEEAELFLSSLELNLRSGRMSAGPAVRLHGEVPQKQDVVAKKGKKKKEKETVDTEENSPVVDMQEECNGEFSIAKDSKCQNGECKGKKKRNCVKEIEKKIETKVEEKKEEKGPRKLDKFGFDVNSNTGKMNAMLVLGEFSKKEIVEKLGCAEGSLNVHFANLRKKGFKLKENKDGKWKLTKTKIK